MSDSVVTEGGLTHARWKAALRDDTVLLGQECLECAHQIATPKTACTNCGSLDLQTIELPSEGIVYSSTTVEIPPRDFAGTYSLAIVELAGARVLGRLEDGENVDIGAEVTLSGSFEHEEDVIPRFQAGDS